MGSSQKPLPRIPGYEIQDRLGGGGQASVYRGVQTSMNRPVAVKIIAEGHPDHAAEVGRFLREARVLAKLRHDNIVQAIDFGEHEGVRYLVMEFIEGTAVNTLLKEQGHLGLHRSLDIGIQVCRALNHASKFDVIHRDIKPANIVMSSEGRAIVVDFGLARPEDSDMEVTRAGISMGTPHYMSPEQIKGEVKLDHRVDIYSLGGTLFHMLTGKVPFAASGKMQILMRHLQDPLEIPPNCPVKVPARVFKILQKSMAKSREQRYQNAKEFLRDLEAAREKLPADGRPRVVASRTRSGRGTTPAARDGDEKLRRQLEEAAATQEQLRRQNETLRRKTEEIKEKANRLLREKTRQLEEAEARAAEMTSRISTMETDPERLERLASERDELRQRLVAAREAVDRVAEKAHEEKEALAARANELDRELSGLREEREELDRRLAEKEAARAEAEARAAEAQKKSEAVSEETRHLKVSRAELVSQLESLEREVEEARGETQMIVARDQGLNEEVDDLRRERDELLGKVRALADEVEEAREQSQVIGQESDGLSSEIATLQKERDELAERIALLESREPEQPEVPVEDLTMQIERLRRERDELAKKVEVPTVPAEEVEDLSRALTEQEQKVIEAIGALEEEKRRADEASAALEEARQQSIVERGELHAECDRLREEIDAERTAMTAECQRLRDQLEAREQEHTIALDKLREEFDRTAEQKEFAKECEVLREKLDAAHSEIEEAKSRTRQISLEQEDAREAVERTRADLESRVDALLEERDAYAEKVRELAGQLDSMREEAAVPALPVYASLEPVDEVEPAEDHGPPMVRIPAGYFVAGEDEGEEVEKPRRRVRLHAFEIDVYPVTNRQYAPFVRTGRVGPPDHWDGSEPPEDILDHPVVRVTWQEAVEYAAWLDKRLPTMLEWQRAARGTDGRAFPWGEPEDVSRLNCKETGLGGTTPVGSYPEGTSPDGVHDMAGNVTEWVQGKFAAPATGKSTAVIRPVCGGSWRDTISRSRCAARRGYPDGRRAYYVGFRCAREV